MTKPTRQIEYHVTHDGKPAGRVQQFIGNKPSERWVTYRHRDRGDVEERPGWTERFRTLRQASAWLVTQAQEANQ